MSARIPHKTINNKECKRCYKCKTHQPLESFYKGKAWDGLAEICKECSKELMVKYYANRMKNYESKKPTTHKICMQCGKVYKPSRSSQRYCDKDCIRKVWDKTPKGIISRKYESHKRRARIANVGGKLKPIIIERIINENKAIYGELSCIYCGDACEDKWHLDHKKPLSRGGDNSEDNLCVACPKCNLSKYNKTYEEYIKITNGVTQ